MIHERLYFDYNATRPMSPQALSAMIQAFNLVGNPSSTHSFGRLIRREVEEARQTIARLVNAPSEGIIFTSGGSEANNTVIRTYEKMGARILVSAIEHPCVLNVSPQRELIPITKAGVVNISALENLLEARKGQNTLVSVMMVNNETGVIQPLQEVVALARRYGARVHTDAVQALGKIPVSFTDLGVDYLALSSHKIGGPQGIGALIVKQGAPFEPFMIGAGQEKGRRAGTYNTPAIIGFAAACENVSKDSWNEVQELRDYFEDQIRCVCPDVQIFGVEAMRVPNTSYLAMPGVNQETQLMAFDLDGIAVSGGSACSSGKVSASHVLLAMGYPEEIARQAIRISFGPEIQKEHINRLIKAWKTLYERTQRKE